MASNLLLEDEECGASSSSWSVVTGGVSFEGEISEARLYTHSALTDVEVGAIYSAGQEESCGYGDDDAPPNAAVRNLDDFYSDNPIGDWEKVLGQRMHFHFGVFDERDRQLVLAGGGAEAAEAMGRATDRAVRALYDFIPVGARVLDIGCGWCGPLSLLRAERDVRGTAITISAQQVEYCRDVQGFDDVIHADAEALTAADLGDRQFDVVLMIESIAHIAQKESLLRRLRQIAASTPTTALIVRANSVPAGATTPPNDFGGSMIRLPAHELIETIKRAGWQIVDIHQWPAESVMPSYVGWGQGLDNTEEAAAEEGMQETRSALGVLRLYTKNMRAAGVNPLSLPLKNELVDVVAVPMAAESAGEGGGGDERRINYSRMTESIGWLDNGELPAPDPHEFPLYYLRGRQFTEKSPIDIVMRAGDTVFIPPNWWHLVLNSGVVDSVNYWTLHNHMPKLDRPTLFRGHAGDWRARERWTPEMLAAQADAAREDVLPFPGIGCRGSGDSGYHFTPQMLKALSDERDCDDPRAPCFCVADSPMRCWLEAVSLRPTANCFASLRIPFNSSLHSNGDTVPPTADPGGGGSWPPQRVGHTGSPGTPQEGQDADSQVFLSRGRVSIGLHHDDYSNSLTFLRGEGQKRLLLWPPSESESLYPTERRARKRPLHA